MADMTDDDDDLEADFDDAPPDEAELEDADLDVADLDVEDLDEEDLEGLGDELGDDLDEGDAVEVDDEDDDAEPVRPRARNAEDEDEEEEESDDVEADLDTILKDRLATYDEDEEDEEQEAQAVITDDGELPQRREFEFPCPSCFLLVNAKTVRRSGSCPQCDDPIEVPAGIG